MGPSAGSFQPTGITLSDSDDIRMTKPGRQWQVRHGSQEYSIRREPIESNIFVVTSNRKTRASFSGEPLLRGLRPGVVRKRILSEFKKRGIDAEIACPPDTLQWYEIIAGHGKGILRST